MSAPAHVGQRGNLDGLLLEQALHALEAHQVVQRVVQRPQVGVDLLRQVARQEPQPLAGLDGRPGQHQALHRVAFHGVDGAGHRQPGLAGAGRPHAERDVVLEDVVHVVALARRARAQVGAARAQHHAAALVVDRRQRLVQFARVRLDLHRAAHADLDQAELDVVDRQRAVGGLLVKAPQGPSGQFGLFALYRDPAAAARQFHAHAVGELAQVLVQRAAQVGEVDVVAIEIDDGGHGAAARLREVLIRLRMCRVRCRRHGRAASWCGRG